LSGAFPVQNGLKQGVALLALIFNFAFVQAVKQSHNTPVEAQEKEEV
jgi:hypothetical protein